VDVESEIEGEGEKKGGEVGRVDTSSKLSSKTKAVEKKGSLVLVGGRALQGECTAVVLPVVLAKAKAARKASVSSLS